jgi:hypothetical protein
MYRLIVVGLFLAIVLAGVGGCGCNDKEPVKITDRSRLDRQPGPTQHKQR